MKNLLIIIFCWLCGNQAGQGLYACKNARVSLFSSAPIEDIAATSTMGASVYNPATGDLLFSVNISTFKFRKSLMQEHFNSDYMESDKYPRATFKGKIQGPVDISKNGTYPVTAIGELDVHDVKLTRTIPGTLTINNGVLTLTSEFTVKCVDHHIDIPKIVFHNIAESIQMKVSATYAAVQTKN